VIWSIWFASFFFLSIFLYCFFFQVFPDGFFPAGGKSLIEGIFPLPYFEWFQFNKVSALVGTKLKSALLMAF